MHLPHIAFIGAGNMARAIILGLIEGGCPPERIHAADPEPSQLESLNRLCPVRTHRDNAEAVEAAEVVVFAVKPQVLREVAEGLGGLIAERRPLLISIAAGVRCADLAAWLGCDPALVRSMPNTPALVRSAATALFATPGVSGEQRELAETILRTVGLVLWLEDEAQMDAVTAVSGSGPAYFFLLMEAMVRAGVRLGLSEQQASLLTLQTAFGAAKLALESDEDAAALRRRVTSPGGTTERALRSLLDGGFEDLVDQALTAARERARELARSN